MSAPWTSWLRRRQVARQLAAYARRESGAAPPGLLRRLHEDIPDSPALASLAPAAELPPPALPPTPAVPPTPTVSPAPRTATPPRAARDRRDAGRPLWLAASLAAAVVAGVLGLRLLDRTPGIARDTDTAGAPAGSPSGAPTSAGLGVPASGKKSPAGPGSATGATPETATGVARETATGFNPGSAIGANPEGAPGATPGGATGATPGSSAGARRGGAAYGGGPGSAAATGSQAPGGREAPAGSGAAGALAPSQPEPTGGLLGGSPGVPHAGPGPAPVEPPLRQRAAAKPAPATAEPQEGAAPRAKAASPAGAPGFATSAPRAAAAPAPVAVPPPAVGMSLPTEAAPEGGTPAAPAGSAAATAEADASGAPSHAKRAAATGTDGLSAAGAPAGNLPGLRSSFGDKGTTDFYLDLRRELLDEARLPEAAEVRVAELANAFELPSRPEPAEQSKSLERSNRLQSAQLGSENLRLASEGAPLPSGRADVYLLRLAAAPTGAPAGHAIQVAFDPSTVASARRVGATVHRDGVATALYQLVLRPAALDLLKAAAAGPAPAQGENLAIARWGLSTSTAGPPGSHAPWRTVRLSDLHPSWESASPALREPGLAVALGDALSDQHPAAPLRKLLGPARALAAERPGDPQAAELLQLVERASELAAHIRSALP